VLDGSRVLAAVDLKTSLTEEVLRVVVALADGKVVE